MSDATAKIPGRCHFDADGWLQGPIAITHYTSPNHYPSGFADQARGLVLHTEDGYTAGTVATFMNQAAQVSAFFGAGEDGAAQQFLPVGQGMVAWAEGAGNPYWRSCECEDKTKTGQPMTPVQIAAVAQIVEACSAYDGFPLQVTDDVNGHGLITHGDGGVPWGDHPDCPGEVRRAQRLAITALARQIRTAAMGGWIDYTTTGSQSLLAIGAEFHCQPSTILRKTVEAHGPFAALLGRYINHGRLDGVMPAGIIVSVPGPAVQLDRW